MGKWKKNPGHIPDDVYPDYPIKVKLVDGGEILKDTADRFSWDIAGSETDISMYCINLNDWKCNPGHIPENVGLNSVVYKTDTVANKFHEIAEAAEEHKEFWEEFEIFVDEGHWEEADTVYQLLENAYENPKCVRRKPPTVTVTISDRNFTVTREQAIELQEIIDAWGNFDVDTGKDAC